MVYVDKSTLVLVFAPDAVVLPVTLCVFFEICVALTRLKLLAARRRRVVFRIHAYCHLKEFFIRPSALPVTAKNFGSVLTTFRLLCATCSLKYILYGPVDSSSGNTG